MLTLTPVSFPQYLGAALSALIVVACFIGLTLSEDVYEGRPRRGFFCYYTNLSNLLVLFYFAWLNPRLYASQRLAHLIPSAEYCVAMCILLTHMVFHFMVLPYANRYTRQADTREALRMMGASTLLVHYIVPWLTAAYFLCCTPGKRTIPLHAALLWTVFPLSYMLLIFLRGRLRQNIPGLDTPYPYPFMDIRLYGPWRVALHCGALFMGSVLFSGALLLVFRVLPAFFPL